MGVVCLVLDLRNIPPPLLRLLKHCLLQLANLYAASSSSLPDLLALCYVHSPPLLKIAYRPGEKFNLRDFHHAVNNLPLDGFLPEQGVRMQTEGVPLANLFSNRVLYSWGSDDISKKVIAICMSTHDTEALRRSLMDAAEQCITVEFLMLETEASFMCGDVSGKTSDFTNRICDLENCVIRRYNPETQVLHGLVKRWLEELKDDMGETLQAVFVFRDPIVNSVDRISCNLYASANQIIDGFPSCQTCRCHGHPIDLVVTDQTKWLCPIASRELAASDLIDTAVKIGKQTVLFLPTSEGGSNLRQVPTPISFDAIERTELALVNEGVIMGTSHVVIPSSHDVEVSLNDEVSDQNSQIFYGLCETLFKLDQGLVCSSAYNTETMKAGALQCYYLLQPSDKGPMLLRRLAGSEEILPLPDVSQTSNSAVPKEMKDSIETSLSKVALKVYNPLHHERGFHSKVNCLVKDSLQFGSIAPACAMGDPDHLDSCTEPKTSSSQGLKENKLLNQSEKTSSSVTEEWEKLIIIDEMTDSFSSPVTSRAADKPQSSKLPTPAKPLDVKTSRILERLEAPKPKKQRASSKPSTPLVPTHTASSSTQMKKPLLPFEPISSQPLKPSFNRLRRKLT